MFSIEVITLLLVYKILFPQQVFLLRGNHESRKMTTIFSFRLECTLIIIWIGLVKYNQQVYDDFMFLFDFLPLCALIDESYFAVHGGISPNCKNISEIKAIDRFTEIPAKGVICDFLWSDPSDKMSDKWSFNANRQCSYFYGAMEAQTFLNKNKLKLIIRGH